MKSKIGISVCLATFNGAQYIGKQIDSVLKQLDVGDEIIISDDSSTDNTLEILDSYRDSRIKIIPGQKFRNPALNFENALLHAQGEIIFLCDQDDIWFDTKVHTHLNFHKKYDLVISDAIVADIQLNVLYPSFFSAREAKAGIFRNILRNGYIGCCMSFNRKIIEAAIPFPKNIYMHDWWIGLIGELNGNVYFVDKPQMYYIRHSSNASATLEQKLPFIKQVKNRVWLVKYLILSKFKI